MQGIIPCLVDNCRKNEYNGAVNGIRLRIGTARRGGCCFVHVLKEAVDPRKETIPMADEKNRTVLTKEGLKKLEEQLDYYISVRRNEIAEQIAIARGFGDLSENAEYDEAKKEQGKLEEEIVRLDHMIRTAIVINDDDITTEQVNVGTTVTIKVTETGDEETYEIVGAQEADPFENRISNESLVGAALLGHKVGDTVVVEAPAGDFSYEILSITRK